MTQAAAADNTALSVESLLAKASNETGLDDFGDPEFMRAFNKLVDSTNNDALLSQIGAAAVAGEMHRILINRLRFAEDLKKHPEILEEDVSDPIVVLGMPRTGTTKLQQMMSADPHVQKLYRWRLLNPAPFPDASMEREDPRIEFARQSVSMTNELMSDWQAIHAVEAEDVDEEVYLMIFSGLSMVTCAGRDVPSYSEWVGQQSMDYAYRYMKQLLQYLQWQDGGRRNRPWILKSPAHIGTTDLLRKYFPKAALVYTHRDIYSAVASLGRLMETSWNLFHDAVDRQRVGETIRNTFLVELRKHMLLRERMSDELDILDIQYEQICADAIAVIQRIYQHAGRDLTPERKWAMLTWEAGHPQHARGKISYRLEDYGFTREDIDAECQTYLAKFGG